MERILISTIILLLLVGLLLYFFYQVKRVKELRTTLFWGLYVFLWVTFGFLLSKLFTILLNNVPVNRSASAVQTR